MMLYDIFRADRLDEGAKDRFREMFSFLNVDVKRGDFGFLAFDNIIQEATSSADFQIREATRKLGKPMIPWYLRWYRYVLISRTLYSFMSEYSDYSANDRMKDPNRAMPPDYDALILSIINKWKVLRAKYREDLVRRFPGIPQDQSFKDSYLDAARDVYMSLGYYIHFYDTFPDSDYNPEGKIPSVVDADLRRIETQYKTDHEGIIPPEKHAGKEIIKFPDGSAWFDLEKGGCSIEAQAMGHCGNGAGQPWQTVLSYRVPVKRGNKVFWRPHLTFILDKRSGMLGEMKGRGNYKPTAKYHSQIIALLKNPLIKGIEGGGYLPENNFSVGDLPPKVADQLIAEKPELADFEYRFKKVEQEIRGGTISEDSLVFLHEAYEDNNLVNEMQREGEFSLAKRIPYWNDEKQSWVVYGKYNGLTLMRALFPGEGHGRLDSYVTELFHLNEFDAPTANVRFRQAYRNHYGRVNIYDKNEEDALFNIGDAAVSETWDNLPDEIKRGIKEYTSETKMADYLRFIEGWRDEDGLPDGLEGDPLKDDDGYFSEYITEWDFNVYECLQRYYLLAHQYGLMVDAQNQMKEFLDRPTRSKSGYDLKIDPWGDPGVVLASTDTFLKLMRDLGLSSADYVPEWLKLQNDLGEPDSGTLDWDKAEKEAPRIFANVMPKEVKRIQDQYDW